MLTMSDFCYCFSQGSVATHLRFGGKYNNDLIGNLFLSPTAKTVKISQFCPSYA